jgi:hypothetical protein
MADKWEQYAEKPGADKWEQYAQPSPTKPKAPQSFGEKALEFGGDVLKGAGASAMGGIVGGGDLIRRGLGMQRIADKPEVKALTTPPSSLGGKIGSFGERTAEFLLPGAAEEKLVAAAPKGLRLIARAASSAFSTGALSAAHGEAPTAPAAIAGGMTLVGGALTPAISAMGRKIQASTIRPRIQDVKDGFKWATMDRFKLKGNLEQSLQQVESELARLRTARNAKIAPGRGSVDIGRAFDEAERELAAEVGSLKFAGQSSKAKEALQALRADTLTAAGSPTVDIRIAENAKEHFGVMGTWVYGRSDPESKITELVANKVYSKFKTAIESAVGAEGPEVRALNKQMQDLIPVKHAMLARLPVEERNRLFSLTDIASMIPAVVTGDVRKLGLTGLTMAQKNLRFGNWLNNASKVTKAGSVGGKLLGGTQSQLQGAP